MVEHHLERRGVKDPRVLEAFRTIPRHLFVPESHAAEAYADHPISIGAGQTISQPYVVAAMLELLEVRSSDSALEVGAGSGYATALLALLARTVVGLERIPELAAQAERRLEDLGLVNATILTLDGSAGCADRGPYDVILVSASAPRVPRELLRQLAPGGRLVAPVGSEARQELVRVEHSSGAFHLTRHGGCAFVPLIGVEGWRDEDDRGTSSTYPGPSQT
jgi:protein-L-isoaspartate(D-aspartate) O-methyltransferase